MRPIYYRQFFTADGCRSKLEKCEPPFQLKGDRIYRPLFFPLRYTSYDPDLFDPDSMVTMHARTYELFDIRHMKRRVLLKYREIK